MSGRVGFRQCLSRNVRWDNIQVTTDGPGEVVSADDYDAWGMQLEGRSINNGDNQARYKFLAKEHDTETGYEWLEARGYDARVGRFLIVDPLAGSGRLRSWSPYHYSYDNPLRFVDPTGMGGESFLGAFFKGLARIFTSDKTTAPAEVRGTTDSPSQAARVVGEALVPANAVLADAGKKIPTVGGKVGVQTPTPKGVKGSEVVPSASGTVSLNTRGEVSFTGQGDLALGGVTLAKGSVTASSDGSVSVAGGGIVGATSADGGGAEGNIDISLGPVSLQINQTVTTERVSTEITLGWSLWLAGISVDVNR